MMFLIRFWRSLTKKDSVESAKYDIQIFSSRTSVFGRFFTDPDRVFSGSDPDFWSIRIRTQEKSLIRCLQGSLPKTLEWKTKILLKKLFWGGGGVGRAKNC